MLRKDCGNNVSLRFSKAIRFPNKFRQVENPDYSGLNSNENIGTGSEHQYLTFCVTSVDKALFFGTQT